MKLTELYPDTTAVLVLDRSGFSVTTEPMAQALKLDALFKSSLVEEVQNPVQQEIAVAAQTALDNLIRLTEKSRKQIKAPVIELGRKIDDQAESFVHSLHEERTRVSTLIGNFQQLELAKVRAAEAAIKVKTDHLEHERQIQLSEAKSFEERDDIEEFFNSRYSQLEAKIPVAPKAEGQTVKNDWDIVVTDPYKLAKYHPQCVNITAKVGEIKQLLAQGITVNGVTATTIIKVGTRPVTQQKAIEV